MKEGTQTFMEESKASRATSGTQALHRPEVLLKPHTPLMLECFFSKPEDGLTAPIRNITMNIHALFFFNPFRQRCLLDQDFKKLNFQILD